MDSGKRASFAAKWPEDVVNRGYSQVHKCLYTCMSKSELNITSQELTVLINIIDKCWNAGDKAYPSVKYLAKNIGKSESTTRALTKSLTEKGFISKEQRHNSSNLYGLEPLAKKLEEHLPFCRFYMAKFDHDNDGEMCMENPNGRRHEWESFEKDEGYDKDGRPTTKQYWNCVLCNTMYHITLKGEPPTPKS